MSIFLSFNTIKPFFFFFFFLFTTHKKIPCPVKNSLCHYMYIHLSSAKHYFGNRFFFYFFFYSKSSSKSPLSLFHVIGLQLEFLHLFSLRCSQAGSLLLKLSCKNFRGQCCSKQDGTALHQLCCRWIYLPEHRGWGLCFLNNNKNTKYSLLFWGKPEL